jgi:dTDP-4-dehydrorhamnose reductase
MIKILVLGIKGMAGHVLFDILSKDKKYDVFGVARNVEETDRVHNIDVHDKQKLRQVIDHDYDYVINCIGILNKHAEENPDKAIWFNSYFPHYLESITAKTTTRIIHISTDCVFSGRKGNYTENDTKDGIGFYAQSKALGEIDNNKDLTIRTSIIGPELNENGIGLFHWFATQNNESTLKGFSEAYWSGITTVELAEIIKQSIDNNLTGIRICAANQKIDKYHLLKLFNEIFKNNSMNIIADNNYKVDKSLKSIHSDYIYTVREYPVMLNNMYSYILQNSQKYSHYNLSI